jgi:hypothetical protein
MKVGSERCQKIAENKFPVKMILPLGEIKASKAFGTAQKALRKHQKLISRPI